MIIIVEKFRLQFFIFTLFLSIFFINISIEYSKYLDFSDEEIYETKVEILNIYPKEKYDVYKLKASDFEFFTSFNKNENLNKFDLLNVALISQNISFVEYLKGFYTKVIYFDKLERTITFKDKIIEKIDSNHDDKIIKELFQALFLAVPISKELREICTNYGISHLIALSGFHLAVLSFCIYWFFYFPYSYIHQTHFPYRNKKYDLLLLTIFLLFCYLIMTGIVPSLLRAFVMFCLGIYFLRVNIKLVSFMTLLITILIVLSLFPKYFFSLGFWFSIIAVFYIFLYIKYFIFKNKIYHLFFFNFWMFLVFNPIVHFYFPQTSYEQFLSPLITIFFTFFYPFEIVAHIFDFSIYFDDFIKKFLYWEMYVYEVKTPFYFFIIYLVFSLASIFYKKAFWFLNLLMIIFNIYLYIKL